MTAKHTPGPWKVRKRGDYALLDGPGWTALARIVVQVDDKADQEGEANAALIAAAPEMLEALRDLVSVNEAWNRVVEKTFGRPPGWTDGYLEAARAAIAKAEGRE